MIECEKLRVVHDVIDREHRHVCGVAPSGKSLQGLDDDPEDDGDDSHPRVASGLPICRHLSETARGHGQPGFLGELSHCCFRQVFVDLDEPAWKGKLSLERVVAPLDQSDPELVPDPGESCNVDGDRERLVGGVIAHLRIVGGLLAGTPVPIP